MFAFLNFLILLGRHHRKSKEHPSPASLILVVFYRSVGANAVSYGGQRPTSFEHCTVFPVNVSQSMDTHLRFVEILQGVHGSIFTRSLFLVAATIVFQNHRRS
jgi:hypothetical protein